MDLELETVIDYIQDNLTPSMKDNSKKGVFLSVDELRKADNDMLKIPESHRGQSIVSSIGSLLNDNRRFGALISTLDVGPVKAIHSASRRPIDWVPLPPATPSDAVTLFTDGGVSSDLSFKVELFSTVMGGHFRSLENGFKSKDEIGRAHV